MAEASHCDQSDIPFLNSFDKYIPIPATFPRLLVLHARHVLGNSGHIWDARHYNDLIVDFHSSQWFESKIVITQFQPISPPISLATAAHLESETDLRLKPYSVAQVGKIQSYCRFKQC